MELGVWTSEDSQTYWVKGHVDIDEFNTTIDAQEKEDYGENRFADAKAEHGWFKAIPDNTGNYRCRYYPSREGVVGAFKATTATIY